MATAARNDGVRRRRARLGIGVVMSALLLMGALASAAGATLVGANFVVGGDRVVGSPISFTDRSAGDPAWVYWNFGDGRSAREPITTHTYSAPGTYNVRYTVCATATNCDTVIRPVSIVRPVDSGSTPAKPVARFAVAGALEVGRPVTFTDRSAGEVAWVYWAFADGSSSRQRDSVTHTFARAGTYNVRYSVCAARDRCDLQIQSIEITAAGSPDSTVGQPPGGSGTPVADFGYTGFSDRPPGNFVGTPIDFSDRSSGDVRWVYWNFGDGSVSRELSPTHTYDATGRYSVRYSVCVSFDRCDTKTRSIEVGSANGASHAATTTPVEPTAPPTNDTSPSSADGATNEGPSSTVLGGLELRRDNAEAWSPDGSRLAVGGRIGGDYLIQIWEVDDLTAPRHVLRGLSGFVRDLAWSPDSRRLAGVGFVDSTKIWDLDNPTQPITITDDNSRSLSAAWSPDGSSLITTGSTLSYQPIGAQLWKLDRLDSPVAFPTGASYSDADWSNDGSRLLTRGGNGAIRVWDPNDLSEPVSTMKDPTSLILSSAWSPDGTWVATTSSDHIARVWDVADPTNAIKLVGHTGLMRSIEWSPDGTRVATASRDGSIRIWDPSDPGRPLVLTGHGASVGSAYWSPDGSVLASASDDGTVRLWDLADPTNPVVLTGHTGVVSSALWSPDGDRLASFSEGDDTVRVWTID